MRDPGQHGGRRRSIIVAKTRDALSVENGPARRGGLRVSRLFTSKGTHPYDELTWERRDAVITNWRDGTTAFEQRDLEFPATWSQNATNIVAQKYFRGPLGTPQREHSVRQMVDRVAGTITRWGAKDGYFATDADADAFQAELTHLLVNQKAAFNSPVWFNVGVEPEPQCSACQPYDALVSTPTGMVPIGELVERRAIGMVVYDAHGETRVRAVKANGDKRVFRVLLRNGTFIEATADHLVYAVPKRRSVGSWLRVDQLRPGMRLHLYPHRGSADDMVAPLTTVERQAEVGGGTATLIRAAPATREASEAALAGWLQADGFVGQYATGTNTSLTIEFQTVTEEEHDWVQRHLEVVFPEVHQHVRTFETADTTLTGRRTRLYGEVLRPFVESWGLLGRRHDLRVPARLWNAPNEAVAAYLRSIFQADGYVTVQGGSGRVAFAVISERWTEDIQVLLLRLGIYSRRLRKTEPRPDRSDLFEVQISMRSERSAFRSKVGFLSAGKAATLDASLELDGKACPSLREEEVVAIEDRGVQAVFDIQTDSGEYLSNNIRVHNCFILSVSDTMPSILNWYVEEGMIFKGGSGSGINLSTIRSSREQLGHGGEASGPVSFMRGADASAGTIKSGGKTRRAAKMVVLNVDHPDVRDFIWCKAREEHKARVLRDAGFDMDLDGRDSISIQYQNANNSVRVTDDFMRAYEAGDSFDLKAVLDGRSMETLPARDLMREIAQAAWECADPGMQYDTTINDWHTTPESGRINASNPCSEYMHLDNSACNLASLNLLKFLGERRELRRGGVPARGRDRVPGPGDHRRELLLPDREDHQERQGLPAARARLRQPGGAADGARQGVRLRRRAGLGGVDHRAHDRARLPDQRPDRPGDRAVRRLPKNREPMLRVMGKHRAAVDEIDASLVQTDLFEAARTAWDEAIEFGQEHGYRNAQASVFAPTGTIGLLMDCDTTGIEPDLALVKTKKLVGGGSMSIVNQTVPRALRTLGYADEHVQAITEYVAENNSVQGAPALRSEHYDVFDCAMGDSPIHYMGHIRMMAAAQPFLAGQFQDGEHARARHGRGRGARLRRGLEARPQGAGHLPRQLQGRPAAVGRPEGDHRHRRGHRGRPRPGAQAPAQAAAVADDLVPGRGHRGLPDGRVLPGRRARGDLLQGLQAGLDPVGRDGRLRHRHQPRPPVRGAAGGVRGQVRQHDLRAQRHDRRQGRPHRPEPGRLPGPPAGDRLPGRRDPPGAGDQDHRRAHRRGQRHRRAGAAEPARRPGARPGPGRAPAAPGGHSRRSAPAPAPPAPGAGVHPGHGRGRRPLLLDLRGPDAPGRLVLRLRVVRHDQRVQLRRGRGP